MTNELTKRILNITGMEKTRGQYFSGFDYQTKKSMDNKHMIKYYTKAEVTAIYNYIIEEAMRKDDLIAKVKTLLNEVDEYIDDVYIFNSTFTESLTLHGFTNEALEEIIENIENIIIDETGEDLE